MERGESLVSGSLATDVDTEFHLFDDHARDVTARAPGPSHHVSDRAPERADLPAGFQFGDATSVVQPRVVTQSPRVDRQTPA